MATDKTVFDDWLKNRLYRDLVFRGIVWISVPAIASYYAIRFESAEPLQFMIRTTETVMRIQNIVGAIALYLAIVALMFKDLEVCDEAKWGQQTRIGRFGGVFRRVAGDLTLWSLGAVLTIVTVTCLTIALADAPLPVIGLLGGFLMVLIIWVVVISFVNILVRRGRPTPVVEKFNKPNFIGLAYLSALVLFPIVVWIR